MLQFHFFIISFFSLYFMMSTFYIVDIVFLSTFDFRHFSVDILPSTFGYFPVFLSIHSLIKVLLYTTSICAFYTKCNIMVEAVSSAFFLWETRIYLRLLSRMKGVQIQKNDKKPRRERMYVYLNYFKMCHFSFFFFSKGVETFQFGYRTSRHHTRCKYTLWLASWVTVWEHNAHFSQLHRLFKL
jgi:hypothetical protein